MKNGWKTLVISLLVFVVVFHVGVVIYIADENYELTSPDYYDQEIAYQTTLDALQRGKQLTWSHRLEEDSKTFHLKVFDHEEKPVGLENPAVVLYRPDNASKDFQSTLAPGTEDFSATIPILERGRWRLTVTASWNGQPVRYQTDLIL